MNGLTGTWRLVRLALRRDRIKLPAWIVIIVGMLAANVPAVTQVYAKGVEDRTAYALTNASSLIGRLFNGPLSGPSVGEIVTNETFLSIAVMAAFMSTLAVVRHTRQNEEAGRLELIGSAVVARHAPLAAALIVALGANIVLGAVTMLALVGFGMPATGSVAFALALASVGICFASLAAVAAQVSESARGANSLAGVAIGLFFLLRAAGDSLGHLTPDKMGIVSLWPSWLSPLGWAQQVRFYNYPRWWVFGLMALLAAVLLALAIYLNTQRDQGSGLVATRPGPARAARSLLSPLGLAWRLQKGVLKGWVAGIAVFGLTIGLVVKEFANLFAQNEELAEYIKALGGEGSYEKIFFGSMLLYACIVIGAYVVQALQRLRTEEASGRLEPMLSASMSRYTWLGGHALCVTLGVGVLLVTLGFTTGLTYVLYADASLSWISTLTAAAFAQAPAILALGSFAAASFAVLPRAATAIGWSAFGFCLFIGQFGELLKLPQVIRDISPFTHTPTAPAEDVHFLPLALLLAVAVFFAVIAAVGFRRRDSIGS